MGAIITVFPKLMLALSDSESPPGDFRKSCQLNNLKFLVTAILYLLKQQLVFEGMRSFRVLAFVVIRLYK